MPAMAMTGTPYFAATEVIPEITFPLHLHKQEFIDTLFKMTPYYYKTSREGQAKLRALDKLETHAEFFLVVYRKI
jgi:23S rRNA (guanine745-N1)-methyltransferase